MRTALTIAGSDSGGGAGIQADLKAFSAHGVFGMTVITAVTAQNTQEVRAVQSIDPDIIKSQIEAIYDDLPIHAVKIGMLSNPIIIEVVATAIKEKQLQPVILDPVMVSKGGHSLLENEAITMLKEKLIPLATLITPNIPEAETLLGYEIESQDAMEQAVLDLAKLGSQAVLLKGGHLNGDAADVLYDGKQIKWFFSERIHTKNTHGTGCTLSSSIAANMARGHSLQEAVADSKIYITEAIRHSLALGNGHGPTHHFYHLYQKANIEV